MEKTGNKLNYSKAVTGSCPLRSKLKVTRRLGYPLPITRIKIISGIEEWGRKQCYVPTNNDDDGNNATTLYFTPNIQEIKIYNNSTDNDRGAGCPK